MLKKFFQENKVAALGALAIFLVLQVVLMNRSHQNVLGLLAQQSSMPIGCYYRLNCPPNTSGEQSTFRCLPILVCPTPSIVKPSISQSPLSCQTCLNRGNGKLCRNTTTGSTFCANNITTPTNASCITCRTISVSPTRLPSYYYPTKTSTRYYNYPSPTRYFSYPSPTRYYTYPSPTRTYYNPPRTATPVIKF